MREVGSTEPSVGEVCLVEPGAAQLRFAQPGVGKVRPTQYGPGEVGSAEHGAGEMGAGEMEVGQAGGSAELGAVEIGARDAGTDGEAAQDLDGGADVGRRIHGLLWFAFGPTVSGEPLSESSTADADEGGEDFDNGALVGGRVDGDTFQGIEAAKPDRDVVRPELVDGTGVGLADVSVLVRATDSSLAWRVSSRAIRAPTTATRAAAAVSSPHCNAARAC